MTEYQDLVEHRAAYLILGDLDKPFHRPECECENCEEWRADKGRPTHLYLRSLDGPQ